MTGGLGPLAKWRITRGGAAPTICLTDHPDPDPVVHCNTESRSTDIQLLELSKTSPSAPAMGCSIAHWTGATIARMTFTKPHPAQFQTPKDLEKFTKAEVFRDTKEI